METNVDWNLVCLVCLQEGIMHSIYEEDETGQKLNEKIAKCSNINFSLEPNTPEQICESCLSDLVAALRFRTNCENSHQIFKSIFTECGNRSVSESDEIKKESCDKIDTSILLTPKKRYSKDAKIRVKQNFVEDECQENVQLNIVTEDLDEAIFPNLTEFLKKKAKNKVKTVKSSIPMSSKFGTKNKARSKGKTSKCYFESSEPKRKVGRPKCEISSTGTIVNKSATESEQESASISKISNNEWIDKNEKLVCEMCGNTYKHPNTLRLHMLRHENIRQFKCELCPKAFVADTDLKRHMRVHTGEKPYACKYCDRKFSDFGSRGKHERTHTGERPYQCKRCNKAFSYSHVLNAHQLVHTGIKKFKCNNCDKGFTKKVYLDNHMRQHLCEIRYEEQEIKEDTDMKELKLNDDISHHHDDDDISHHHDDINIVHHHDNIVNQNEEETTYEPDLRRSINVTVQEDSLRIQQKSVFTIVKTESGLAEVQYYLPVVD